MTRPVAAAALAAILLAGPALADRLCANVVFDGSSMRLDRDGDNVTIAYVRPRAGLDPSIRPGTVAFQGRLFPAGGIGGRGYAYKAGCSPAPVALLGRVEGDDIVLHGLSPTWTGCQVAPPQDGQVADATYLFRGEPQRGDMAPGTMHNGSRMKVDLADGHATIAYVVPRAGLAGAGVQPGMVVFRGVYDAWRHVRGVAYVFKRGCSPAPYAVSGDVRASTLELRGNPPRREGCAVRGEDPDKLDSALVFTGFPEPNNSLVKPVQAPRPVPVAEAVPSPAISLPMSSPKASNRAHGSVALEVSRAMAVAQVQGASKASESPAPTRAKSASPLPARPLAEAMSAEPVAGAAVTGAVSPKLRSDF